RGERFLALESCGVAQHDGNRGTSSIGDSDVKVTIRVKVAGGYRDRSATRRTISSGSEGPIAVAQQNGNCMSDIVGEGEVPLAISIEVGCGQCCRSLTCAVVDWSLGGTV